MNINDIIKLGSEICSEVEKKVRKMWGMNIVILESLEFKRIPKIDETKIL